MSAASHEHRPKILIVDEESDTRALLRAMLTSGPRSYQIEESVSGEHALKIIPTSKPDLILLDIVLPDLDGISILRSLKQDFNTRDIRVVMVTARSDERMMRTAMISGADDYLTKPITQEKLVGVVERLLPAEDY